MTIAELRERQSWTLEQKIDHSLGTIESFVNHMGGLDKVYIAFSGGKDSTVLSHLARMIYPGIKHTFCNTGNEYPEIIQFVNKCKRSGMDIDIIRPKFTPREVWAKYGFPLVSKEVGENVHAIRANPNTIKAKKALGELNSTSKFCLKQKWMYLIKETYDTHNACCDILKKKPAHRYQKETGRAQIVGMMASESLLRESTYIRNGGCNVYNGKSPKSLPLSIWLEKDIWDYIKRYDVEIASIYAKGVKRTGCMGCGFGAQFSDDVRFRVLYKLYPKCYNMVMNYENNGIKFREALRKMLAVNKLYLPDEEPRHLFSDYEFE